MKKILVVDDDRDMCLLLNRFLTRKGYSVTEMYGGKKALDHIGSEKPDLIISDFRLEDMDGIALLTKVRATDPSIPFIIITGYSDIKTSVNAIKLGAFDYVTKPLLPDEILITIQQALAEPPKVAVENKALNNHTLKTKKNEAGNITYSGSYIFGDSESFKKIMTQVDLVAPTNYSVIIYGESGSGKEAIAQEVHKRSKRSNKPFVAIDCGALSKELAASEFFGHEKGSFTGAINQKIGSFELANGGTVFLDEVANLSYEIQVSLLRVVQERKMRRIGGLKDIELDVRILIASNEKLWDAARNGKFREDLYHRFNEFNIDMPPLRQRKDDIMTFAGHFLRLANEELGKNIAGFAPEVEMIFKNYIWYGNLRELKNVIKKAALLTESGSVEASALPFEISNYSKLQFSEPNSSNASAPVAQKQEDITPKKTSTPDNTTLKEVSIDAEYELILKALKQANYNKSKAAKILQIDRKTLYNKMSQYQELKEM